MVRILLKTTLAGPQMTAVSGDVIEVEEAFAKVLINGGYAELVERESEPVKSSVDLPKEEGPVSAKVERAVKDAPEKAVATAQKRKGK